MELCVSFFGGSEKRLSSLNWHGEDFLEKVTFEPDLKDNQMVTRQRGGGCGI